MRGVRLLRIGGVTSFGGRVLIACLISTGVALLLFASSAFLYEKQSSERNLTEQLNTLARILAITNKQGMDLAELGMGGAAFEEEKQAFREALQANERVISGGLIQTDGALYLSYPERMNAEDIPHSQEDVANSRFAAELWVHQPVVLDGKLLGHVALRGSREVLQNRRVRYGFLLLGATILATLFSALITNKLRLTLTRPITDIIRTTNMVTESKDYTLRVPDVGDGELSELGEHINHMLSSINERDKRLMRSESAVRSLNDSLNDKNKELETIIYVTSHDLRSPLVNIQGFGRELQSGCDELKKRIEAGEGKESEGLQRILGTEVPEALSFILASSAKMGALLSGLLRLSRLGSSAISPQAIDVDQMLVDIRKTFEFQLQEARIELRCESLESCYGDPIQINQAFSNLLDNAIKYTAIKFPRVEDAPSEHGLIEVSSAREGAEVVYTIRDNGVGISPRFHNKVFEVFHRLDPKKTDGEGLGLTITQRMVKRNGGSIRVESTEGEGTAFFLSLPAEAPLNPDPGSGESQSPARSG